MPRKVTKKRSFKRKRSFRKKTISKRNTSKKRYGKKYSKTYSKDCFMKWGDVSKIPNKKCSQFYWPQVLLTVVNVVAGTTTSLSALNLATIFKIDGSNAAIIPGQNEMLSYYGNYRNVSAKIEVTFDNNGTIPLWGWIYVPKSISGLFVPTSATTATTFRLWQKQNLLKLVELGPVNSGTAKKKITFYTGSFKKYYGDIVYKTWPNLIGTISGATPADPVQALFGYWGITNWSGTLVSANVYVQPSVTLSTCLFNADTEAS